MAIVVVAILACAGIGVAVYEVTKDNGNHGDRTVTDIRGREVSIPNEVNKVVCVSAGALRMVSYFDIDRVVGVTDEQRCQFRRQLQPGNHRRLRRQDHVMTMSAVPATQGDDGHCADHIHHHQGVDVLDNIGENWHRSSARAEVYFIRFHADLRQADKTVGEVLKMNQGRRTRRRDRESVR